MLGGIKIKELENLIVIKRSGQRVEFNQTKILLAIKSSFESVNTNYTDETVSSCLKKVLTVISDEYKERKTINIEDIQNIIEDVLKKSDLLDVYEAFNSYRSKRNLLRETMTNKDEYKFLKVVEVLNEEINKFGNSLSSKQLLGFGKAITTEYSKAYLLDNKYIRAHDEGYIYIKDIDTYMLGLIEEVNLNISSFKYNNIRDYLEYVYYILNGVKNEHYGTSILARFDKELTNVLLKELKLNIKNNIYNNVISKDFEGYINFETLSNMIEEIDTLDYKELRLYSFIKNEYLNKKIETFFEKEKNIILNNLKLELKYFFKKINTINSFYNKEIKLCLNSSGTSEVVECFKTVIIEEDYNNLIFTFSNPLNVITNNKIYYEKDNYYDSLTINSTVVLNVARLALSSLDKKVFYNNLNSKLDLIKNLFLQRFEIQSSKTKEDYKYLFDDNFLEGVNKLEEKQRLRKIFKNGFFRLELVGLYDSSKIINFQNPLETSIEILEYINSKINLYKEEHRLGFVVYECHEKDIITNLFKIDKALYASKILKDIKNYDNLSKYLTNTSISSKIDIINNLYKYHLKTIKSKINNKFLSYEVIDD